MFAAADTFRAAATEQLNVWGERCGIPVVSGKQGGDSAAVAYDSLNSAVSKHTDYLLIDLLSLFLISQSKLCSKPTIRGTVLVQIGLYLYTIIYLFAPAQFYEKEIPTSVIALGTLFYLFVAFKSFKAAKLLSPIFEPPPTHPLD